MFFIFEAKKALKHQVFQFLKGHFVQNYKKNKFSQLSLVLLGHADSVSFILLSC